MKLGGGLKAGTGRTGDPHHAAWVGPDSSRRCVVLWEGFLLITTLDSPCIWTKSFSTENNRVWDN